MTTLEKLKQQLTPGITLDGILEDLKSKLKSPSTMEQSMKDQDNEQANMIEIIFLKRSPATSETPSRQ